MKRKMFIILLLVAMMAAFGAANSFAACGQYGKVVYVYHTTSYAYFYIAPRTTFPSYFYYFYTNDPDVMRGLLAAVASHDSVYIYGTGTCPTSGTTRYGGTVSNFRIYHNY